MPLSARKLNTDSNCTRSQTSHGHMTAFRHLLVAGLAFEKESTKLVKLPYAVRLSATKLTSACNVEKNVITRVLR